MYPCSGKRMDEWMNGRINLNLTKRHCLVNETIVLTTKREK